jgi:tetratricopeptide (TPR) repeat protein
MALASGLAAGAAASPPAHPWDDARQIYERTLSDYRQGGFGAIAPHLAELEAALAQAGNPVRKVIVDDGATYVLAESPAEASAAAATAPAVTAVSDPYPELCLMLGSYYNEVGRFEDADRVLGVGLTAAPSNSILASEKGAALVGQHRWPEALAQYQSGLAIAGLEPSDRARLLRGTGEALTELDRLDEAEAAYKASLELAPGNPLALNELAYIARLRAGRAPTSPQLFVPSERPLP